MAIGQRSGDPFPFPEALKGRQIQTITLLGSDAKLTYNLGPGGLHIELPAKPSEGYAYAFRIALDGAALLGRNLCILVSPGPGIPLSFDRVGLPALQELQEGFLAFALNS